MTELRRLPIKPVRGIRLGAVLPLLILGLIAGAMPAAAQTMPGTRCSGTHQDANCDALRIRRQYELYDAPPLEQLRDEGVQVRRVFFSRAMEWSAIDLGELTFERRPGHGPVVRFQLPRGDDGRLPEPLVAELTPEAWQQALSASENLERRFVPLRNDQDVCMFSWDYTVELSDPAEGEGPATLYRRAENACYDPSPAQAYVRTLAALAERFFPACAVLRFPGNSEAVSRLPLCAALQGDRIAAAEVRNAITPFIDFHDAAAAAQLFDAFDYDADLDWNGTRVSGRRAVAEHWARAATQSIGPDFRIVSIRGETAARVRVQAELEQEERMGFSQACFRRASVEMIWIRSGDGGFVIRRATVGPFEPFVPTSLPPAMRRAPSPCAVTRSEPVAPPSSSAPSTPPSSAR
jgi:hypothetical protein